MNTTAIGTRITQAAHAAHNQVALQPGMLVVEDAAPFKFTRVSSGGLTTFYDFAVCLAPNGNLVRARTYASAPYLRVDTATPADTLTWNAATGLSMLTPTTGSGVALAVTGATIYLYYFASGTIQVVTSTDNGATWGSNEWVLSLPAQTSGTNVRLAAISGSLLFYTNTTTLANMVGTKLGYAFKSSGTWYAVDWDLGNYDLGAINADAGNGQNVALGTIGAADLGNGNYVVTFYANKLRGALGQGIWSIQVSDLTTTSARWHNEEPVYVGQPVVNTAGATTVPMYFIASKLCHVGNELWCVTLETSNHAGHNVIHLAPFRSRDGIHWSDRTEYLAGSDLSYLMSGLDSAYLVRDFVYGQLLVSGTQVFLLGYDMAFVAQANSKVGVTTNTAIQYDLTPDVKAWSFSMSRASEAFSLSVGDLADTTGAIAAATATIFRAGARLILKAGYVTTQGAELLQLAVLSIDRVEKTISENMATFSLTARDGVKHLTRWIADAFHNLIGARTIGAANLGGGTTQKRTG